MTRRQQQIPGTQGEDIPELTQAALEYVKARDKRMDLTKKEVEKKGVLDAVIARLLTEKPARLKIDRDALKNGETVPVYRFEDADGNGRIIYHGEKLTTKVRSEDSDAPEDEA